MLNGFTLFKHSKTKKRKEYGAIDTSTPINSRWTIPSTIGQSSNFRLQGEQSENGAKYFGNFWFLIMTAVKVKQW